MTPDLTEQLEHRVMALEAEHFAILEHVRRVGDAADRNATSLDELETALVELSTMGEQHVQEMATALAHRQTQLDSDDASTTVSPADPISTAAAPGQPAPTSTAAPGRTGSGGATMPDLDTLHEWVRARLAPMVRKTTTTGEGGGIRWCRQWWEHPDAVERFTAVYLAFQQLSTEESMVWPSVYLRDHVDPHLAVLTSPHGPFHACTPRRHSSATEPLGQAELTVSSFSGGIHDQTTEP